MNRDEFFRETTLRICGDLRIERALHSSLRYLQNVMPVDWMVLEYWDDSMGAMRTIAAANREGGKAVDLLTPVSQEAKRYTEWGYDKDSPRVFIEDPREIKLAAEMLRHHGLHANSLLVVMLESGVERMGALILASEGDTGFTEHDADLMTLVGEPYAVAMSNALMHREVISLKDLLADDNRYLHGELRRLSGDEIIGANFGLKGVMQKVQQVASLDSPVLLLGDTGVGKDVIANAIHYSSSRNTGPFVSVNCGAIPESLIDSELFGHEKGAFTGAISQKRGRFERANKGTIFLDEIGELPPPAQVRLLRVLQSREIERVGGVKTVSLDIRIIAATNRDLEAQVKKGQFRDDLWFRLNVFPIWIPPLRERASDIPGLVQHFIRQKSKELKLPDIPSLHPLALDTLMEYRWPGNVRELENIVERALILNPEGPLSFEQLIDVRSQTPTTTDNQQPVDDDSLDKVVSNHIRKVLAKVGGKVHGPGGAAELLGVNASTLRNRMKKLGIAYKRESRN